MTKKSRGGKPKPKLNPSGRVGNDNAGLNSAPMSSADQPCAGYLDEESSLPGGKRKTRFDHSGDAS